MVTPLSSKTYFTTKMIKTILLFLLAIILIFTVAHLYKHVNMSIQQWLLSGVSLWIGASLFLTLGLIIAQFNETQKASSLANIVNMVLAILGGLWFPIQTFPSWLQRISNITPTYHLKNFALELAKNQGLNITSLFILIVYSILFFNYYSVDRSQKRSELDEKRKWSVRLGELSTLIYLLFPIISIFNEKRGSQTVYLIVLAIFIVSYLMLVIYYYRFNNNVIYSLLVVHYVELYILFMQLIQ